MASGRDAMTINGYQAVEAYRQASIAAAARGKSLNQFISEAVREVVAHA